MSSSGEKSTEQTVADQWETWSPASTPHVSGRYTRRRWNGAGFDPQWVEATCEKCGERSQRVRCDSGRVREKIVAFAVLHLHADPLRR